MSFVIIPKPASPPIVNNRWNRNGKVPDANLQSKLIDSINQSGYLRSKEVFRWNGMCGFKPDGTTTLLGSAGAAERKRWQWAFHTGPFTNRLAIYFYMAQQNAAPVMDCYSQCTIFDGGGSTVGTGVSHYGASLSATDSPSNFGVGYDTVNVSPDTDYFGLLSDFNDARLVAAMVWELVKESDTVYGYLANGYVAQQPIYDTDRSGVVGNSRSLWKRGASQVLNWTVNDQGVPNAIISATDTNIVDTSITSLNASTPGYTLDFTGKNRQSQTGPMCVMKALAKMSGGGLVNAGNVKLKNSAGTTIASIVNGWNGGAPGAAWVATAPFAMPSGGKDKYDLQFSSDGTHTLSLYAVSIYEYEA